MRDYRRMSVYHLLDQLVLDAYEAVRALPANERSLVGTQLLQSTSQATTAVIHGCLSRNRTTLLPYVERAHALMEEAGQHLRILQRTNAIEEACLTLLYQRQQSCVRLLLQWRETLVLHLDPECIDEPDDPWTVAEDPPGAKCAKPGRRSKKYPTLS